MSYPLCIWSWVRIPHMSFIFQVKIKMDICCPWDSNRDPSNVRKHVLPLSYHYFLCIFLFQFICIRSRTEPTGQFSWVRFSWVGFGSIWFGSVLTYFILFFYYYFKKRKKIKYFDHFNLIFIMYFDFILDIWFMLILIATCLNNLYFYFCALNFYVIIFNWICDLYMCL